MPLLRFLFLYTEEAAEIFGFKEGDARIVYKEKINTPVVLFFEGDRLDLFLSKIITSTFSEEMQKRAKQIHEFDKNLIIKVADVHDILIMKAVTGRSKDNDDIIEIIKNETINWNLIIGEAKSQIKLGNIRAILDIGTTLEKLKNENKATIPDFIFDSLWNLMKEQIEEKKKIIRKGKN